MRQVLRLWAPLGAFGLPSPRSLSAGVMAVPKPGLPRAASGPEEHPEASLHAQSFSGLCQCLPGQIQEAVATLPGAGDLRRQWCLQFGAPLAFCCLPTPFLLPCLNLITEPCIPPS